MLENLLASLPGEGPRGNHDNLGDYEHCTGDYRLGHVDAEAVDSGHILGLNEHRVVGLGRQVAERGLSVALESEFVRDLD